MNDIFLHLLSKSIEASIMILVILLIRAAIKTAPRKYSCILWGLVAVRIIMPVSLSSRLSIYNLADRLAANIVESSGINDIPQDIVYGGGTGYNISEIFSESRLAYTTASTIACVIWIAGIVVMITYMGINQHRIYRVRLSSTRVGNICICSNINDAFVFGIINPKIYLPQGLSENDEKYIIAHESTHIERCDNLWKSAGFILLSINWFNPLAWLAFKLFTRDLEMACDEAVIAGFSKDERTEYAQVLLKVASRSTAEISLPLSFFGESETKQRIKSILSFKKAAHLTVAAAIVCCIAAAVILLTDSVASKYSGSASSEVKASDSALLRDFRPDQSRGDLSEHDKERLREEYINNLVNETMASLDIDDPGEREIYREQMLEYYLGEDAIK